MKISDILTINNTAAHAHSDSKKSVLELISKLASSHVTTLEARQVLNTLISREKLGSTAVGHGVALPHARIKGIEKPIGVLVLLNKAIEFDAPDDEPVDLLFGLLIPEESSEVHLETLSLLAKQFGTANFRTKLRNAHDRTELFNVATHDDVG